MFRRSLRICCFLSTFLVSGCGGIEQTLDKSIGKNPYHEFACGPCSLSDYQEIYHEWTPCWDVSHNIIKHQHLAGFIIRDIAGLFNIDMKRITLPSEMIEYLNREGFAVRIFRGNPQECKKYVEK